MFWRFKNAKINTNLLLMAGKLKRIGGIRAGWINGSLHGSLQHFLWCQAKHLFKEPGEIRRIIKADSCRNLGDGVVNVFLKQ